MVIFQILAFGAAMTVALFYFGFGAARVLLPAHFAPWRVLLTPLVGMALVIVWDYLALFFGFDLTRATWGLAVLTTLLNLAALARQWRADRRSFLRVAFPRAHWFVIAFTFVAFAAAVAPLARYGYVTIIGENWDYEFYLPLADYLREMPTAALVDAPSNPLLTTILSRHIFPLPMGFSYLHASLDALLQTEALDTFAILLGVLHAFGILAAFVFFRATFNMSMRAALAAAGLLALNGLLLWFTYWGFGLHLAALALLPVAVGLGIHALWGEEGEKGNRETGKQGNGRNGGNGETGKQGNGGTRWRAVGSAGLFLAALNVTYHPALVAAALPLAGVGVYQLVAGKKRGETILRGAAIVALTIALSFPVLFHLQDFIREYYGRAPLAIGLREFVPFSDGYGFSLYLLQLAVGHTIPTPWLFDLALRVWDLGAPLLTLLALLASLYALWQLRKEQERRAVWYLVVGASVFYIALFRLPFLRAYPYGFLKSLSLVSYVLLALAVQGAAYGASRIAYGISRIRKPSAPIENQQSAIGNRQSAIGNLQSLVSLVFLALFFLLASFTFALALEQYFKPQPAFFDADALTLRELKTRVPKDAEIFLTDRAEVQKVPMGLAAYALRQNPLRGNVATGYGKLENAEAGRVYDYALLARGEEPTTRGYQNDAVWQNETFALYARAPGTLLHQTLNLAWDPATRFELTIDKNGAPKKASALSHAPAQRALTVGLLSFTARTITLQAGEQRVNVELEPGLNLYSFSRVNLPTMLVVTPQTAETLWIPFLELREADTVESALVTADAAVISCWGNKDNLDARCAVVNPRQRAFTWKWIVRGALAGTRAERVIAEGEAMGAPRARVQVQVGDRGNLARIGLDDEPPTLFDQPRLPTGNWRAAVEVWDGNTLLARFPVHPVLQIDGDAMMWRANQNTPPAILPR